MFGSKREKSTIDEINDRLKSLSQQMESAQISEYLQLLNRPWKLIVTNFYTGIFRGVGIAIGFTVFASGIVYVLQALGALNLPIIGGFIADIVKHVQYRLDGY
jgi:hypothetical protein